MEHTIHKAAIKMMNEREITESQAESFGTSVSLTMLSRTDKVRAVLWCLGLMLFLTYIAAKINSPEKNYRLDKPIYKSLELAPLERLNGTAADLIKGDGVACMIRTKEEFEASLSEIDRLSESTERKAELRNLVSVFEKGDVLLYISSGTGQAYWNEAYALFSFREGTHLVLAHELPGGGASLQPDVISHLYCLIELSAEEADKVTEVDFQRVNLPADNAVK